MPDGPGLGGPGCRALNVVLYNIIKDATPVGTTSSNSKPAWQAQVKWETRTVWECFVEVIEPGDEPTRFRVNRRKGKIPSFTDTRGEAIEKSGTGIWGTMPQLPRDT